MATVLGSCRELLLELVVYLWCTVTRLVFTLWFYWKKPLPLPPVTDRLLLRSATSLAADIRNGKVKSVDLVSAYIRRIREVQPIINAVVEERFEEALKDAEEVDRLVASGTMSASQMTKEKPLLGLPFTSKNSIAIRGMRHDAGSLYWHGRRAEEDAPSVASLRRAGAIPLALTNVPELCMWGESHNLVDGCTRNPHDTRRSPGGSSGGEGSLLAAAGSLIGLGTDAAGSVRIPSAYCGIFGHKPTAGANCKS
ncbi:fatty-acid amide hydrolase 2-A-like, partial [Rhipicephalus sanguineus]|uniref:fatty-acid amide hydrolase 2-A-like n=1 Tax=Rhipicephalus sanguineus TaxID=34632 RepID=UPI0020C23E4D